jgi:hypothetical protein
LLLLEVLVLLQVLLVAQVLVVLAEAEAEAVLQE